MKYRQPPNRARLLPAAAALIMATAAQAQQVLVPEDHTWNYLHPMGTLPPRADTTPDPDFDTTWYLPAAEFAVNYDGPSFDTVAVGDPLVLESADSGSGPGPFAYGGVDSITTPGTALTVPATGNRNAAYFRTTFTAPAGGVIEPSIRMICDDGCFVYLDGVLIATVNINDGVTDTYTSSASDATNTEGAAFTFHLRSTGLQAGGSPGDVKVIVPVPSIAEGEHTLAVSARSNGTGSSDLGLLFELSGLDPATCTMHASVSNVVRDLKGTPADVSDDQFSFKVTVTGSNAGASWDSDNLPASGSFGTATLFGPFDVSSGSVQVNFTTAADPLCQASIQVDPPTAFKTLVNYNHSWKVMNPLGGVVPPRPATADPDPDFESTWFLKESSFVTQYDGPTFGTGGVAGSYETVAGPGPFAGGGVDGIAAGQPVGAAGTPVTVPPTNNRRTSYYRTTFTTTEPLTVLTFDLLCDDGVFIYLDGTLVAKENMTAGPGFMSLAATARTETLLTSIDLSQPPGGNVVSTVAGLAPGDHTLAVALHQSSVTSSDLGIALKVSGIEATGQCVMEALVSNVVRSDAGTPSAPGDDTFTFKVTVNGANAGTTWQSDSTVASGTFGVAAAFGPFPVSSGSASINFNATIDPACTTRITVPPPPCTMAAAVSGVARDNMGTPVDPRDDTFYFNVTLTGTFLSAQWTSTQATPASGPYATPVRIGPFPVNAPAVVNFNDSVDVSCTASVTVQPPRFAPPVELVPYAQVWQVMNPQGGVIPDGPFGPDPDFETTWYLDQAGFDTSYNGPTFGSGGVAGSYEAIEGPGPFAVGGVDGLATGQTLGAPGTTLTLPATANRFTSYYRTTFTTTQPMDNLKFDILCDDGAYIYLDGVLIAQENMTAADTFNAFAVAARNETLITTIDLAEAPGANVVATVASLPAGVHTLAVSLHQSSADSSDTGIALTLYGRIATGCVLTPLLGNVTRNLHGTVSPADDTFSFPLTINAVNGGAAGWTSNSVPASGAYGTLVNYGPLPVSQAPKTMIFTDTADPLCTAVVHAELPPVIGLNTLNGTVTPVAPQLPVPDNWTANGAAISHSSNVGVAAPGSIIASEVVNLTGVAGTVPFRMKLDARETSNASNFETDDTVLVELVLNDGASEQRINLITPFDKNADGVLNGYTGLDAADYNTNKASDELNAGGADQAESASHTFALSYDIPDNIVSAQLVVTVVALGGSETVEIRDITFGPVSTGDADTDGDGQTDASETFAGTNPADPADYLRITSLVPAGAGVSMTFPSKTGRNYRAEVTTQPADIWVPFGDAIPGTGAPITVSLPVVPIPGEGKYFLRVRVVP